jgi:hypothetical protein
MLLVVFLNQPDDRKRIKVNSFLLMNQHFELTLESTSKVLPEENTSLLSFEIWNINNNLVYDINSDSQTFKYVIDKDTKKYTLKLIIPYEEAYIIKKQKLKTNTDYLLVIHYLQTYLKKNIKVIDNSNIINSSNPTCFNNFYIIKSK